MRRDSRAGRMIAALARTPEVSYPARGRGIRADGRLGKLLGALARYQPDTDPIHADPFPTPAMSTTEDQALNPSDQTARHTDDVTPALIGRRPAERAQTGEDSIKILQARALARDLARALDLAPDLARDRALALDRALDLALALARALDLAPDLALALALDLDLDRALALALARDLDRDLDLDHVLDRDLARVLDLARDLALVLDLARDLDRALDLARDRALDLASVLDGIPIDVSGADLSHLNLRQDLEALDGVVWNGGTRWPPGIGELVEARSEEIGPGVFQVRGGSERDPVDLVNA